jgi:glycosyltransferase involved in cell wall biosynthesis
LFSSEKNSDDVNLAGELPRLELVKLMHRAKVFLHPSSYEGCSLACIEAYHAGSRVISFHDPLRENVPGWEIVSTKEEMVETALRILHDKTPYSPSREFYIEETVHGMVELLSGTPVLT